MFILVKLAPPTCRWLNKEFLALEPAGENLYVSVVCGCTLRQTFLPSQHNWANRIEEVHYADQFKGPSEQSQTAVYSRSPLSHCEGGCGFVHCRFAW